jgi:plasmid stabilization system protein ParE
MALIIEWSPEAIHNLKKVVHYLHTDWTERELKNFSQKLDEQLGIISNSPRTYKKSARLMGTRECLITKHNSLFYTFNDQILYIVTLWDNRQDPKKLL